MRYISCEFSIAWFVSCSIDCALFLSNFRICNSARHNFARITNICPPINIAPKMPPITKALMPNSHVGMLRFWVNGHSDRVTKALFEIVKLTTTVASATIMMIQSSRLKRYIGRSAYRFRRSRIPFPILKKGTIFSDTCTLVPVRGLRPTLDLR